VIVGSTFGVFTGAALFCVGSPFNAALCESTYGGAALGPALLGGWRGGTGAYATWVIKNIADLNAAQNTYNQQVQNVCSKLPG